MRLLYRIQHVEIRCPRCGRFHVDREEWAHKPHHTHLCEHCDHTWELGEGPLYFAGMAPYTIAGRARALVHKIEDALASILSR